MAQAPNLRSNRRSLFTHGLLFGTGVATGGAATWFGSRVRLDDAPASVVEDVVGGGEERAAPLDLLDRQAAADAAVVDAMESVTTDVAAQWGPSDSKVADRKMWVQYDANMTSRLSIDYENAELWLEAVLRPGETAEAGFERLKVLGRLAVRQTSSEAGKECRILELAARLATERRLEVDPDAGSASPDEPPMLDGVVDAGVVESIAPPATETATDIDGVERRKIRVMVPFRGDAQQQLAERYLADIGKQARERNLAPSLILAMIQTESAFNPRATSPAPAYGLMQLVPTSGGVDAYQFVRGGKKILEPEFLYMPDMNIKLGSAYLQLLLTRYLRAIDDPQSRLYSAIAAYNTGAGNVARAFTGRTSVREAAPRINRLSPDQVFAHLRTRLPFEETRTYIRRVTERQERWREYDEVLTSMAAAVQAR